MGSRCRTLLFLCVTVLLLGCDCCWAATCPKLIPNWRSKSGGHPTTVRFINESPVDVVAYWVDFQGKDREEGPYNIAVGDSLSIKSTTGHRFRIYRSSSPQGGNMVLVQQYEVASSRGSHNVRIRDNNGCSNNDDDDNGGMQAPPHFDDVDHEMQALVHDQDAPCFPQEDSTQWSCIRYMPKEEYENRVNDGTVYGFNSTVEAQGRNIGDTMDTGYTDHIPTIPRLTRGKGYLKMSFTQTLLDTLLPFYNDHKRGAPHDSVMDHGTIPGGYTNSHTTPMSRINLDEFYDVRETVSHEIQRILEWWTGQPLIATSTFGIRIYHSGSMLINHVDRADTHLASAVIQVAQEGMVTGWPLEIVHPDGSAAEVYLQPGELVLYEGARFLHGRPMRLNGTSFANIFSHFRPVDWYGPGKSPNYDGLLDEWGYLPLENVHGDEESKMT